MHKIIKKTKKGFTLIEMLIVVIIIGILASALIPRLTSARGKANDTARKADIQQLATALISYQLDKNKFPKAGSGGMTIDGVKSELMKGGLGSLPRDTSNNNLFLGIQLEPTNTGTAGYYSYITVKKNGILNGGFVVMAQTETEGGSNYVYCSGSNSYIGYSTTNKEIIKTTDFDNIYICNELSQVDGQCSPATEGNGNCIYSDLSQLRYIYKY